ncbi:hypothetical protein EXIGLDRAFT_766346 [Exidia glandulosa HHB12029]|uniref:Alpha/beta-hydrolase n=1 Tax=Exidia glandulosa HHB12029 TaxID=1314781 RepID=A0A165JU30_EXIGL|nr:hypothetical protein EXIGLDRAFT_766346 [Exidia glandulosa HHB12029]
MRYTLPSIGVRLWPHPETPLEQHRDIHRQAFCRAGECRYPFPSIAKAFGTPTIVLSRNYRLGPWSQSPTSPNLGLADQALALSWARAHLPSLRLYRPLVRLPTFLVFASPAGCPMSSNPHTRRTPRLERMLTCLRAVEELLDVMDAAMSAVTGGGGDVRMMSGGIVDVGAYGQFAWALSGIDVDGREERVRKAMKVKNILVGASLDEGTCFAFVVGISTSLFDCALYPVERAIDSMCSPLVASAFVIIPFVPADVQTETDALSMLTRTLNSSTRAERLLSIYSPGGEGDFPDTVKRILGDFWFQGPVHLVAKKVEKAWYYHYTFGRESGHILHGAELQPLFRPSTSGVGMGFLVGSRTEEMWVSGC